MASLCSIESHNESNSVVSISCVFICAVLVNYLSKHPYLSHSTIVLYASSHSGTMTTHTFKHARRSGRLFAVDGTICVMRSVWSPHTFRHTMCHTSHETCIANKLWASQRPTIKPNLKHLFVHISMPTLTIEDRGTHEVVWPCVCVVTSKVENIYEVGGFGVERRSKR